MSCPKSEITAWSLGALEQFSYWKAGLASTSPDMMAKMADALLFLNELWMEEERHEQVEK